jgi:hypothetical protein
MCWRLDVSTVFRVKRNFELFEPAMDLPREIYGVEKPPKISKLSPGVNDLKNDIVAASSSVEMVGQLQSLTLSDSCSMSSMTTVSLPPHTTGNMYQCCEHTHQLLCNQNGGGIGDY